MKLQRLLHKWVGAALIALAIGGCAGAGGGAGDAPLERDYPQAPMRVSVSAEGDFVLTVCATESAADERGPWIQSIELQDLQVDPPLTLWEANLPAAARKDAWNWNPGTPWRATLGKAPKDYENTTPLNVELQRDRLYQISITGWDPGELLFVVSPGAGGVTYYDGLSARKIPRPRMPCLESEEPEPAEPAAPGEEELVPHAPKEPLATDDAPEANFFK